MNKFQLFQLFQVQEGPYGQRDQLQIEEWTVTEEMGLLVKWFHFWIWTPYLKAYAASVQSSVTGSNRCQG